MVFSDDVGKISGWFNIFFSEMKIPVGSKIFCGFFSFLNHLDVPFPVYWHLFCLL